MTVDSEVVTVIQKVFDSVERRDDALFADVVDGEAEFHWPPDLPYGGVVRGPSPGRPGWSAIWDPLQPTEAERRLDPRIVATSQEEAVVLWHQRGLARSGERIDTPVLGLYQVKSGKLRRCQMFYFNPSAVVRFLHVAGSDRRGS